MPRVFSVGGPRLPLRGGLWLPAGHRADDQKRFGAGGYRGRQGRLGRVVRQILLAGKEPHECPALVRHLIAHGASQHGITRLQRVEDRGLCDRTLDLELDFSVDLRQRLQMGRQHDANHGSVCTSTESTAGRSRTIGRQLSPASADAYTWPPLVPKYTPHGSNASTDMASRSTLT